MHIKRKKYNSEVDLRVYSSVVLYLVISKSECSDPLGK